MLLLDSELRRAIENREFELYFQPKIAMENEQIQGLEALVRWNSERLGFVSPAEFITYAEDTGLIIPLSELIIEKHVRQSFKCNNMVGKHLSPLISRAFTLNSRIFGVDTNNIRAL